MMRGVKSAFNSVLNYFSPNTPVDSFNKVPNEIICEIVSHLDDINDVKNFFSTSKRMQTIKDNTTTNRIIICTRKEKIHELAEKIAKLKEEYPEDYVGNYHLIYQPLLPFISAIEKPNVEVNTNAEADGEQNYADLNLTDTTFQKITGLVQNPKLKERDLEKNLQELEMAEIEESRVGTYADLIEGFKNTYGYNRTQHKIEKLQYCCPPQTRPGKIGCVFIALSGALSAGTSIVGAVVMAPGCYWVDHFYNYTYEAYSHQLHDYINVTQLRNAASLHCSDEARSIFVPTFSVGYPLAAAALFTSLVFALKASTAAYDRKDKLETRKEKILDSSEIYLVHSNLFPKTNKRKTAAELSKRLIANAEKSKIAKFRA